MSCGPLQVRSGFKTAHDAGTITSLSSHLTRHLLHYAQTLQYLSLDIDLPPELKALCS
jgi:hypothetical protein